MFSKDPYMKDKAYEIIDRDAIRLHNGDTMVDVSTAYLAVDFARKEEREKVISDLDTWIEVGKQLPNELEQVLVKNDNEGCYDIAFLLQGKWQSKVGKVTHWRKFLF